ncbi:VOC family protein [Sphingomonas tabacisoli]|uniref:VOC family protein n=1 Tax=Sphingomonas tabacisoli TaxID=2249466 RepID=A0ABW4HX88_9SPHN
MFVLAHIALIVRDYDEAIAWFTGVLGFTLVENSYQPEQDKRWVVVAPPGAGENGASILLARAATPEQERFMGDRAGHLPVTPDLIPGPPLLLSRPEAGKMGAGSSPA